MGGGNNNGRDGIGIDLAVRYGPGQLPVLDANGNPTTVPGSGAGKNTLARNRGTGNG